MHGPGRNSFVSSFFLPNFGSGTWAWVWGKLYFHHQSAAGLRERHHKVVHENLAIGGRGKPRI